MQSWQRQKFLKKLLPGPPHSRSIATLETEIHQDHWAAHRQVLHDGVVASLEGQIAIGERTGGVVGGIQE
jgi:hypothetical protein